MAPNKMPILDPWNIISPFSRPQKPDLKNFRKKGTHHYYEDHIQQCVPATIIHTPYPPFHSHILQNGFIQHNHTRLPIERAIMDDAPY